MNSVKKIMALLLAAMMIFALTGCDSKNYEEACAALEAGDYDKAVELFEALGDYEDSAALLAQARDAAVRAALVGEWRSADIDMTEEFMSGFYSSAGDEGDSFLKYAKFDKYIFNICLDFADDGSFEMSYDEDVVRSNIESIYNVLKDSFAPYMTDVYTGIAEEYGMSLEQILELYGTEDVEGIFERDFGMSIDEYVDMFFSVDTMVEGYISESFEGTYTVENGEIELSGADEKESAEYDAASDSLKMTMSAHLLDLSEHSVETSFSRVTEPAA